MGQGRIILADKHSKMLAGIRRLLEDEVETVLMVADEASLHHALETHSPDVVVADLLFILYLELSGFFIEGYRIAHTEVVANRVYMANFTPSSANNWISFFGYFLSLFLKDISINPHFLWYAHVMPSLVWFVYIPHSKLLHIFTSSVTVIADRTKEKPHNL